ncbi:MAG: AMP-binding protein [Actinomycetota bacterium]|nr:AMP-binding protein [Actinomycetota bacterium]
MLTVEMIEAGARRFGTRIAVTSPEGRMTYAEVDELSSRLANAMAGMGFEQLERVGILFGNHLHTVALDFAAVKARLTRVPLNARLAAAEHISMVAGAGVRRVVFQPALTERALELEAAIDGLELYSLGPNSAGKPDLLQLAAQASPGRPRLPYSASDPILALYTSGTTGTLKAALHTQASYAGVVANIMANLVFPARDDVMVHAAPLIHASGTFVLPFWLRGGRAHVLPGFDPAAYLGACEAEGVTHASLVPTMLQMLMANTRVEGSRLALKSIIYGASPMPASTIAEAMAAFGPIFTQYYGQTEAPLAISALAPEDHLGDAELLRSAGSPSVEARVRVLGKDGGELGTGEIGEITVESPFVMAGYLDAPELNAETFVSPGMVRTRDLGYFDDRGYLYLVDRSSDMIVSGGYNVYPREVEDVLLAHPAVAECGVVGRPDPTWVEAVVAFVTLRPGKEATEEELRDFARARLAGYKVPKEIRFSGPLPKSAVGKVLRRALRDEI